MAEDKNFLKSTAVNLQECSAQFVKKKNLSSLQESQRRFVSTLVSVKHGKKNFFLRESLPVSEEVPSAWMLFPFRVFGPEAWPAVPLNSHTSPSETKPKQQNKTKKKDSYIHTWCHNVGCPHPA